MQVILAVSSYTGSTVVFAVDTSRRMMGASQGELSDVRNACHGQSLTAQQSARNGSLYVPAGTSHCAFITGATGEMVQAAAVLLRSSPDFSIACMMTASLRATAIAARLNPSFWCSDGLGITCDNGEKVRVAFALDSCDREAMGHVATTGGITAEDVQDLMVATVEHRYGQVNRVPEPIEWLTDNGSCYTARNTRAFARGIGLIPRTTPVSSPQSNGMAEAFVRTLKRDYVLLNPTPNAQSVIDQLPGWFDHYNEVHPHRALRYRSPREFIAQTCEALSGR